MKTLQQSESSTSPTLPPPTSPSPDPSMASKAPLSPVFGGKRHDFDLEKVLIALEQCKQKEGQVILREYLTAYQELCRFFKLTGRLFGFVAKDLESKISMLDSYRTGDLAEHYTTVQSMVQYEVENNLVSRSKHMTSGSRTLLRLHWALEFILEFMARVQTSSSGDSVSAIAGEVYSATLSHHHPWFTRQMAYVAVHFLPSIQELIQTMCRHDQDTVLELLKKVVFEGKQVYRIIDDTLAEHDLLNLP